MATVGLANYRLNGTGGSSSNITAGPVDTAPYTPPQTPSPTAAPGADWQSQIAGAYKQYLGRDPLAGEADRWATGGGGQVTNPGYINQRITDLQQTTEAKNWATAHPAGAAMPQGNPQQLTQQWFASGNKAAQSQPNSLLPLVAQLKAAGHNVTIAAPSSGGYVKGIMLDGQFVKLLDGSDNPIWQVGGDSPGGGNVFSDPATSDWETMLRQVSGQLNTPQQTPDYNNLVSYLQSYMKQLQQPGYSPAEAEQIQTQSIDPMTHERDNAVQQVIQQYAAKGFRPSDGPVQQAVADVNKQYEQMRTTTHANFATQAAGLTRQNAATAAQVGQGLQTLEQGQQTGNENRALQAVQLMFGIPQMADSRLAAANTTLGNSNAGANTALQTLLQLRQQNQQQGQWNAQQEQAFWANIGNLLVQAVR